MPDAGLRAIIRQHLMPEGFFIQSIESGMTSAGIPDAYFCHPKASGWIECKRCEANAVDISSHQVGWIESHARYGGRAFVAIRKLATAGKRREAADELWLAPGSQARQILLYGLRAIPDGCFGTGGPSRWDWEAVKRAVLAR